MNSSKYFPTLYQTSSTNRTKVWKIWVTKNLDSGHEYGATIHTEHGYEDGKMQNDEEIVREGKNIGKANETTPFDQACCQAQSKWNKKKDKGYTEKGEAQNTNVILPVLATKFSERKHDIVYPAFAQPKLNGVRCVVHTDLRFQSRLGKFWTSLDHLKNDCKKIIDEIGFPLDGEIYIHGLALQDIGALVKKERIGDNNISGFQSTDLEYWLFDYIDTNTNFLDRVIKLRHVFSELNKNDMNWVGKVHLVHTNTVMNEEHINSWHKEHMESSFEGTIIRNDVPYEINKRTKNLQKKKDWDEAEFKIVGGKSGVGRDEGCCTFILETDKGDRFDSRPVGTLEQRKKYLKEIETLIGKLATVRLQEYTNNGVPFHSRVISIRDYE